MTKVKKKKCTYESLMEDQSHQADMNFFSRCDPKYTSLPTRKKFVKLEDWEFVPSYNMWSCENLQNWLTSQGKRFNLKLTTSVKSLIPDDSKILIGQNSGHTSQTWSEHIFPQMKSIISETVQARVFKIRPF